MNLRTYRLTGVLVTTLLRLLRLELRVSGLPELPDRPILFVANHFTRFETFLLPYVIYQRYRRPVKSLGGHVFFSGWFGRYLASLGVVSVRDPRRNRTIVGDLMARRSDWVIYPEGGLIKNKKTVEDGRLHLQRGDREGPPHTGAAIMALKSELYKRRYLDACRRGQSDRIAHYQIQYGIGGARDVSPTNTVIVPITITYPRLRSGRTILHQLSELARRPFSPRLDEELQVEGTILFRDAEISLHLGTPIDVDTYLPRERLSRRLKRIDLDEPSLARPAERLTEAFMRTVYGGLEINFDHLFCTALRVAERDAFERGHVHRALHLAALALAEREDVRMHPSLERGIVALSAGRPFEPLASIVALAEREGVLHTQNGTYLFDRTALAEAHDFHAIRLDRMVQVIANEAEPVTVVVDTVRKALAMPPAALAEALSTRLRERERRRYLEDRRQIGEPLIRVPVAHGEPFLLEARRSQTAIVLVHGYLACPEQMRPLAETLHAAGHTVYAVRLPGHGTAASHLHDVTWSRWLDAVARGCAIVRPLAPRIVVGGFSLGGVLAALHAATSPTPIDGLFTINAPLRLRHRLAPFVPAVVRVHDLAGRLSPRIRNVSETPTLNYDENPLHGTREVRRAMHACRRVLPSLAVPTLVIQSDDDPVAHPESADLFRDRMAPERLQVIHRPGDRHVVVQGVQAPLVFRRIVTFIAALNGGHAVSSPGHSARSLSSR